MEKAIIFGGAGFMGSHLADVLSNRGFEVTIFDVVESLYLQPGQNMIVGDILDQTQVEEAIKGNSYVFNFAGIADIDECARQPVETIKYNVLGNTILLEASRINSIKRFVYASSAYVYSKAGAIYKSSKQASELIIETYKEYYGLNYTIVRYGSLYGPRSDDRNSIYRMLKEAILQKEIKYKGTGEEVREYIHVVDAAESTANILSPEYENQNIVLTGTMVLKYSDLLKMIKEMLNNEVEINFSPKESETHYTITPYNFSPKLGKKLVNNPHIDMGQGLLQMMDIIYKKYHLGEKGSSSH